MPKRIHTKAAIKTQLKKPKKSSDLVDIESCALPADDISSIRLQLLSWYDSYRRKLPWRGDQPPYSSTIDFSKATSPENDIRYEVSAYGTWVSEVMLQQTRVDTVIAYYTKWMEKFPTLQALSEASQEEVNAAWAGLGYYRRARALHEGAKTCINSFEGELPKTAEMLQREIKGIGPYTAGAISSIAYGEAKPCVDGNVIRVFSRLHHMDRHNKDNEQVIPCRTPLQLTSECWNLADILLDKSRPGDFNQALMELGATICTPRAPQCSICPLRSQCQGLQAFKNGSLSDVSLYPSKAIKKKPSEHAFLVCVPVHHSVQGDAQFLLIQRPSDGLLANQWEFPAIEIFENVDETLDGDDLQLGSSSPNQCQNKKSTTKFDSKVWSIASKAMINLFTNLSFDKGSGSGEKLSTYFKQSLLKSECIETTIHHIFSHQKHSMHLVHGTLTDIIIDGYGNEPIVTPIEEEVVVEGGGGGGRGRVARWMTEAELAKVGITSGANKVLEKAKSKLKSKELKSSFFVKKTKKKGL